MPARAAVIGLMGALALPAAAQTFPNKPVRLIVANSDRIADRVAEHTLDIGLIEAPAVRPRVRIDRCCEDELMVICSPRFPLARLKEVTPQQLLLHPFGTVAAESAAAQSHSKHGDRVGTALALSE